MPFLAECCFELEGFLLLGEWKASRVLIVDGKSGTEEIGSTRCRSADERRTDHLVLFVFMQEPAAVRGLGNRSMICRFSGWNK